MPKQTLLYLKTGVTLGGLHGLSLSEVSPTELSHGSIGHWLRNKHFRPREIWGFLNVI